MKRLLLLAPLAAAFTACNPDIPQSPDESDKFVVAEFDPANSVIPLPNDLVFLKPDGTIDGRLHAPEEGGTPAQNEFNRDYLNHLDGFPLESTASMLFDKPIDPDTVVLGTTLGVFDITDATNPLPVANLKITVADAHDGAQSLSFIPTSGYWTRGHRYGVLVRGGDQGIKGRTSGQTVTGSPTWALVTSSTPLIDGGIPATSAIPTTEKDPAAQYDQQVRLARQLEQLRLNYKPAIDFALLTVPGLSRADIALFWTFTITSQAEVTFDPAHSIIPFPNDILNPTQRQVTIPVPPDAGLLTQLYQGLNTLDGFSTTAPIVSENGLQVGALIQGTVEGSQFALDPAGPINMLQVPGSLGGADAGTALSAFACVNCTVSPTLIDGGVKPETLEIVPRIPLNERTRYAVYVTTDLKDTTGKNVIASPAFALVRSSTPLFDGTHSTVSLLTDAQAEQLEQLRLALEPLLTGLDAQGRGIPRKNVALAWAFTTQSTISTLQDLHYAALGAGLPTAPTYVSSAFSTQIRNGLTAKGIQSGNIATFYVGGMVDLFALVSPVHTFNPGLQGSVPQVIPFVMTVPNAPGTPGACSAPAAGFPVSIFAHGLTRDRNDTYALADSLAKFPSCQVAIGIDEPWHGERNTCTGFGAALDLVDPGGAPHPDRLACLNPATMECVSGRCVADAAHQASRSPCVPGDQNNGDAACILQNQGVCIPDANPATGHCEGGTFASSIAGTPVSGWSILNLQNFFATRDNFRQQVIDVGALIRVLQATDANSLSTRSVKLDPTKISFAGQSLGGILGTLSTAVAPEIGNVLLNSTGADPALLLLTSPTLDRQKRLFIAGLDAQGVTLNSPLYDQFLGIAKWILDPADPANAAYYLTHEAKVPGKPQNFDPSKRRAFIQWIVGDTFVVNPSTVEWVRAAVADPTTDGLKLSRLGDAPFWSYQFNGTSTPFSFDTNALPACTDPANHPGNRHGFLLSPPSATCGGPPDLTDGLNLTINAQTQAVGFLIGQAPF